VLKVAYSRVMKRLGTAGTEITLFLQEGKMLKTIKKQSNKKGVT